MENSTPFHTKTIDAMCFILEDMKRKMIRHIASKTDLPEEEMIEKYCNNPVSIKAYDTIQIQGIMVQEGPVYIDPPVPPPSTHRSKTKQTGTKKPKKSVKITNYTDDQIRELVGDEKTDLILEYTSMIQEETDKMLPYVCERMMNEELFDRKETREILKNLNIVLNKVVDSGIITKTQISNRMNRNITNILHGADPTKDKTLRKIAKENPKKFFDLIVNRVKNTMIQNLSKE